jgi:hypothetical protein
LIHNAISGTGCTVGGITVSGTAQVTLLTTHDFDRVWAYYQQKCKLRAPGTAMTTIRSEMSGTQSQITYTLYDDVQPHSFQGFKSDLLRARGFYVQSLHYTLVGFVYQLTESNQTCIHLVYRPNTEFISLLKDRLAKD